jgi:hypothetical protein
LSPNNESLLYSYKDENPGSADAQYRISTIEESGVVYLGYFDTKKDTKRTQVEENLLATGK